MAEPKFLSEKKLTWLDQKTPRATCQLKRPIAPNFKPSQKSILRQEYLESQPQVASRVSSVMFCFVFLFTVCSHPHLFSLHWILEEWIFDSHLVRHNHFQMTEKFFSFSYNPWMLFYESIPFSAMPDKFKVHWGGVTLLIWLS